MPSKDAAVCCTGPLYWSTVPSLGPSWEQWSLMTSLGGDCRMLSVTAVPNSTSLRSV